MTEEIRKDTNLNEMLNTEEVAEGSQESHAVETAEAPVAEATAEVADTPDDTPQQDAEADTPAPAAETSDNTWQSLYDFVAAHSDKITNASLTNIGGFSRVPQGKYMLFCSNEEDNADLILFERPNTMWMDSNVVPESIKVESSGIVIKAADARFYVGKNNITKVSVANNHVAEISTISRAKSAEAVKVSADTDAQQDTDVDTVKLHVKRISPRLYNVIKDMTTKDEIKTGIIEFMQKIYDLNHLVKIEKELLYTLGL